MATHPTKAVAGAKPAGSERKYDRAAVMTEICERTVSGETLLHICKSDGMPAVSTVFSWLAGDVTLSEPYTRARTARADVWAEELIEIADDSADDFIEHETPDGGTEKRLDSEHVQRSKLRVAARQWVIAKHSPQRYGGLDTFPSWFRLVDKFLPPVFLASKDRSASLAFRIGPAFRSGRIFPTCLAFQASPVVTPVTNWARLFSSWQAKGTRPRNAMKLLS